MSIYLNRQQVSTPCGALRACVSRAGKHLSLVWPGHSTLRTLAHPGLSQGRDGESPVVQSEVPPTVTNTVSLLAYLMETRPHLHKHALRVFKVKEKSLRVFPSQCCGLSKIRAGEVHTVIMDASVTSAG